MVREKIQRQLHQNALELAAQQVQSEHAHTLRKMSARWGTMGKHCVGRDTPECRNAIVGSNATSTRSHSEQSLTDRLHDCQFIR